MSRSRTLLNVTLTAVAVLVAVAWAASAVPLHAMAQPGVGAPASAPSAVKPGSEPKIVHRVNPDYPPSAKEEGVEGLFRIEVVVGTDGAVEAAQIIASAPTKQALGEAEKSRPAAKSGDARLAEAALAAVRQWRWEPVLRDGKPVAAKMTVTVNFALHDKKQPH